MFFLRAIVPVLFVLAAGGLWLARGCTADPPPPVVPDHAAPRLDALVPAATTPTPDRSVAATPLVASERVRHTVELCGRVVDADGRGLARAEVGLWLRGLTDAPRRTVSTGPDGRFRLRTSEAPPFVATLTVKARALAPLVVDRFVAGGIVDVGDLVSNVGGSLTGMVVTTDTVPVSGARTRLVAHGGPLRRLPRWLQCELAPSTLTGPDGRYAWSALPAGSYSVEAVATGRERRVSERVGVAVAGRTELAPLVLAAGNELRGRVLSAAGACVPRATVALRFERGIAGIVWATTGYDGTFSFAHLPAGPFQLQVVASTWPPLLVNNVLPARDLVLQLRPGARVRGCVRGVGPALRDYRVRVRRVGDLATSAIAAQRSRLDRQTDACAAEVSRCPSGDGAIARPELIDALRRLAQLQRDRRELELRHRPFGPAAQVRAVGIEADGGFVVVGLEDGLFEVELVGPHGTIQHAVSAPVGAGADPFVELLAPVTGRTPRCRN